MSRWPLIALALVLGGAQLGCPQPCPSAAVSIHQLIGEYNDNASMVPRLWALARVRVRLPGMVLPWDSVDPTCVLLLKKGRDRLGPHSFVLIGREAGQQVFRLGSDASAGTYYLWYQFGDHGEAWWGRHELAGAPGVKGLPIDPNQFLAVLSVCELPDELHKLPAVALAMDDRPEHCAYVLSYIDRQPISGRILFKRRVYFKWDCKGPRRL